MKAIVNEGCIGCGGDIPEEELPAAAEARDGCPVSVIDIQAD